MPATMRLDPILASTVLAALCSGQGMIVVSGFGSLIDVDLANGSVTFGVGRPGLNGLATDGVNYWSCQVVASGNRVSRLVTIDPLTGATADGPQTARYQALTWDRSEERRCRE